MTIRNIDIDKLMGVLTKFRETFQKVDVQIDESTRELILTPVLPTKKEEGDEKNITIPTKLDKGKSFTDLI
jgi:hypothetical protein